MSEKDENDILLKIRRLNKFMRADFDRRLTEYGLTGPQGRVLFFICREQREGNPVHQNDIEKKYSLSKSTVSELVTRMEKNSLIQRKSCPPFVLIEPTDKGTGIVDAVFAGRTESIRKAFRGFTEEEIRMATSFIERMTTNMEEEEETNVE